MLNIKKLVATALVSSMILTSVACSKVNTSLDPNQVLGKIGDVSITLEDVDSQLFAHIEYLKKEFGEDFEKKITEEDMDYLNSERIVALNQLIQEKVLLTKAAELNLIPEEEKLNSLIDEYVSELKEYYGGDEGLAEAKKQFGYTDESFNSFIKNQVIQEIVVEEVTKDVSISDDEIKSFYDTNKDKYFTQGAGATTKHILFENEQDALACKKEIQEGTTTFEDAFNKYKRDMSSSETKFPLSEDLGFVEYEQEYFDKDFLAGLKPLKVNELSSPVKSSFGYHLIMVSDISTESVVTPLDEAKDSISEQLVYEKKYEVYQNQLTKWKEEMNVKITASSIGYDSVAK